MHLFMPKIYLLSFIVCFLFTHPALAQAPFTATWSFEGNSGGTSSSGLVAVSDVDYIGVNKLFGTYHSGYVGQGVSLQHWSTTTCNHDEYAQFSIQPQGKARVTVTSLSFAFSRSDEGPQQLIVRSSADGFSSDIYSQTVLLTYQTASITLSGSGFNNQPSEITFHIYGCNPVSSNGTLRLDEISINAAALPVTLLSFTAKPEGDRVQLAWSTTSEIDADRFVLERSHDSGEYVFVGEVAANGTIYERQYYSLTDMNPRPGMNYYRLKQIDLNGTIHLVKPISVIVSANEPVVAVYPNPASPDRIHLRLWNADDAIIRLLTMTGQPVGSRLERGAGEADLIAEQPLPAGLYFLEVTLYDGQKRTNTVLVR